MSLSSQNYPDSRLEMLKYIPAPARRILEVGCGTGAFAMQLLSEKREVWGVEPDTEGARIAASRNLFKVFNQKIEDVIPSLPNDYFDTIIFNDVLEHLYDPWGVLRLISSKLSDEGKIIACVPNFRYVTSLYEIVVKKDWQYRNEGGVLVFPHIRFFTRKSIESMFATCGYRILRLDGITRTKSMKGFTLALLINLLSLGYHRDIFFKQFAIVAEKSGT